MSQATCRAGGLLPTLVSRSMAGQYWQASATTGFHMLGLNLPLHPTRQRARRHRLLLRLPRLGAHLFTLRSW